MSPAPINFTPFRRRWWMISKHVETIAALYEKDTLPYHDEVVLTPDKDEVMMSWLLGKDDKPLLVIFHGLEGCAQSHTVRTIAKFFHNLGWTVAVPHFRSCGHRNLFPRAYHAADDADVRWMVEYLSALFVRPKTFAVGVSLGGNALIQYLATSNNISLQAAATISAPLNLPDAARRLSGGITHLLYGRHFVKLLRAKLRQKLTQYPALCTAKMLNNIRTIGDFDRVYTAPAHGFAGAEEYWQKGAAIKSLFAIKTPLLCINAKNDPLVAESSLPRKGSSHVMLFRPKHGGHGAFIGTPNWLGDTLQQFFVAAKDS